MQWSYSDLANANTHIVRANAIEPFPQLPPEIQATDLQVFYASGREASTPGDRLPYGNAVDSSVHLGKADVIFGEGGMSWNELLQASTAINREKPVTIQLGNTIALGEVAKIPVPDDPDIDQVTPPAQYSPAQQPFFDAINAQLALEHRDLNKDELRKHFRIGTVIFAAADVEVDLFLSRLEDIASVCEQTVVTVSDADEVLDNERTLMRGASRVGITQAEQAEQAFIEKHDLLNVSIVDVSRHKELCGFDIEGHHYWYRHPWMSSDVIFLLKHGAPAHERALSRSEETGIWYFAPDYPDAVKAAARLRASTSGEQSKIGL